MPATLSQPAPGTESDTSSAASAAPFRATFAREALQRGLAAVVATIPTKTTLPVLAHALLRATEDGVEFTATDLDRTVTVRVPADDATPGTSLMIPARKLNELARELAPGAVTLARWGAGAVKLQSGKASFKLYAAAEDEFPVAPHVTEGTTWTLRGAVIHALAQQVSFAASQEESRPILNGVLWEMRATSMAMIATDGHRLAKLEVPVAAVAPEGGVVEQQVDLIVPPDVFALAQRLFTPEDEIAVTRRDNQITMRSAEATLTARLIEGPYPNYRAVIPAGNDQVLVVERAALTQAIKRVATVSHDQSHRIVLTLGAAAVKVAAETPDLGEASDEIAATYEGTMERVAFNATYLLSLLAMIPTPRVELRFKTADRAVVLFPVTAGAEHAAEKKGTPAALPLLMQPGASYTTLAMPLRLEM